MRSLFLLSLFLLNSIVIDAQSLDFTIMSYNIQQPYGNNWDERKDSAVAILTAQNIDVIGTQEAINSQRDYLLDNTSGYNWYGVGRKGGDSDEGCWIFYKEEKFMLDSTCSGNFWLSETPDQPSSFGDKYNRICTYVRLIEKESGFAFYVFNAHFPTPDLYNGRMSSMKLLLQRVSERENKYEPVYITGDFNSRENDGVTKWAKSGGDNPLQCRDTYRDVYPEGNVTTGFGTKYDYIYCPNSERYVTSDSWVINTPSGASDHLPIAASVSYLYLNENDTLPTADAGADQRIIIPIDGNEKQIVYLDGTLSFASGSLIDSYVWMSGDSIIGEGELVEISLEEGNYPIFLYVTDTNGNSDIDQVLITIDKEQEEVSGFSHHSLKAVEVFPQPANNYIYVVSEFGDIENLKLLNTDGHIIAEEASIDNLNVQHIESGLYVLEITIGNDRYIQKIIKN